MRRSEPAMPFRKQTAWGLLAVVVATGIALMVGRSEQTTGKPPPIPKAGPQAKPRSLNQVGLPFEPTQKVIPQDNPQTPEKIALGQKLFFDGRLWLNLHKGTKCEIGIARNACLGAVESTASEVTEEPVTRPVPVGHRNP